MCVCVCWPLYVPHCACVCVCVLVYVSLLCMCAFICESVYENVYLCACACVPVYMCSCVYVRGKEEGNVCKHDLTGVDAGRCAGIEDVSAEWKNGGHRREIGLEIVAKGVRMDGGTFSWTLYRTVECYQGVYNGEW